MDYLLLIIISLIFSAFFSGMEIAFISANKLKIELDKKQKTFASGIISIFLKNPKSYISTMLIGNNVALVIYSIIMAKILEPVIALYISSDIGILTIQTIISTLIILIIAEFFPKVVFRLFPNVLLNIFALPVMFFYILFYPINKSIVLLSKTFLSIFFKIDISKSDKNFVFSKIDLDHLVNEIQSSSSENDEVENDFKIFQNALDFSSVKLRDCIIPRTEIEAVNIDDSIEQLTQKFIETGYSKLMVYKDSIDNIIGYVHSIEIFNKPKQLRNVIKEVLIVPETMPANKLLAKFIKAKKNIAVVVDEFGGTSGIVTIEDIMEEIFGEIDDEHDSEEFIEKKISDTEFIFSGRLEIDNLNETYNLKLPESDEYSTIAGLILFHHQNIPNINDVVCINNYHIKIIKAGTTKIELIRLIVNEE